MTEEIIEKNYDRFLSIIKNNVNREGIENLVNWLNKTDAKIAPASTKFHLSCKGGLIKHCLDVYDRLKKYINQEYNVTVLSGSQEISVDRVDSPYSEETIAIVALFHDLSKVNYYEVQERNTKDENGNWIKVPFYQVRDESTRLIFGSHSMNSYYMVSKFIKLTYEEELAILHHMGGLDNTEDRFTPKNLAEAYKKSNLAVLLHLSDMAATFIDEATSNE